MSRRGPESSVFCHQNSWFFDLIQGPGLALGPRRLVKIDLEYLQNRLSR